MISTSERPNHNYDNFPKIGIRPIIDGRRRGIRESLESTTLRLARSVAELLSSNLKHTNGDTVEYVVPDFCIGGVAESARVADLFSSSNVGVSISVTQSWCYGSETMDMDPFIPKAVWGFNGTERPGAVYLAAVLAAYNQKGLPAFSVYGQDVQDAGITEIPGDVRDHLIQFAKAGIAAARIRGKSYLAMGGVSMGIAGSIVDHPFFEKYLGMHVESIDMSEFIRRIEENIYDDDEFKRALQWVKNYCKEGKDYNPKFIQHSRKQKDLDWEFVTKMALIARDLMLGNDKLAEIGFEEEAMGHNAIAGGFQGQRQWSDHFPNGDFMEAILNTSFDWNGTRPPIIFATENDSLNAVSMLFGNLLTNTAQIFADVRTYWSPESVKRVSGYELNGLGESGMIHLLNSGAASLDGNGHMVENGKPVMKPYWKITNEDVENCLSATTWYPGMLEYFRGGGYSSGYVTQGGMPMTMSRINLIDGIGPVMQIAEGESLDLPEKVHKLLNERTNPTWPSTWFVPRRTNTGPFKDVFSVMNSWGANHAAISYGHIGSDLITLASILRIPVNMHNIPESQIFRPSAWNAFGTDNLESADYRACNNFGPLYR